MSFLLTKIGDFLLRTSLMVAGWLTAEQAMAATSCPPTYVPGGPICVATGVVTDVPHIIAGIVNVFLFWSAGVTTTVFLIGAFTMVASGGGKYLENGKNLMKAALIGYAIILSAWLMMSTVVFFIAG